MSKAKTARKATKKPGGTKGRRARRALRKAAQRAARAYIVVGPGDHVETGKGERRTLGTIIGNRTDGKGRITWLVVPRS